MFYYVKGTVAHLEQGLAVVDCGGVGYALHCSQNTLAALKIGEGAKLYTYLHVREDIFDLFGFESMEELHLFKQLTSVSGVGPKAALSILSVAPTSMLALSLMTGDEKLLTQASGIGKKIAQRVVLELRDKVAKEQISSGKTAPLMMQSTAATAVNEAISALMVLGYSQAEAYGAMEGLATEGQSPDGLIKACLKKLAVLG